MWAAKQGLAALDIKWTEGANASFSSASLQKDIAEGTKATGAVAKKPEMRVP